MFRSHHVLCQRCCGAARRILSAAAIPLVVGCGQNDRGSAPEDAGAFGFGAGFDTGVEQFVLGPKPLLVLGGDDVVLQRR
jgi:hypothetical protein